MNRHIQTPCHHPLHYKTAFCLWQRGELFAVMAAPKISSLLSCSFTSSSSFSSSSAMEEFVPEKRDL
ncbi:unnamed protein product, partial [Vitis vinifera]